MYGGVGVPGVPGLAHGMHVVETPAGRLLMHESAGDMVKGVGALPTYHLSIHQVCWVKANDWVD
mgnify:CR=1 FL=1